MCPARAWHDTRLETQTRRGSICPVATAENFPCRSATGSPKMTSQLRNDSCMPQSSYFAQSSPGFYDAPGSPLHSADHHDAGSPGQAAQEAAERAAAQEQLQYRNTNYYQNQLEKTSFTQAQARHSECAPL